MTISRTSNPSTPALSKTLMGFNQLVKVGGNATLGLDEGVLRVVRYEIGIKQVPTAPDYVTGRQDRTAWIAGKIESEGSLEFPFTYSFGKGMLLAGANLALNPGESFSIESSIHPPMAGCKINTIDLSCNAGEHVKITASVWGIVSDVDNSFVPGSGTPVTDIFSPNSGGGNTTPEPVIGGNYGDIDGITTIGLSGLDLEQIPQWDVITVAGAPDNMHVTGFALKIDNKLLRNYTMGDQAGSSPFGLNATSITANQRMITGSLTWQSDMDGTVAEILGVGIKPITITIGSDTGGSDTVLTMPNCMFEAMPPTLAVNERVTVTSNFTAMGTNDAEWNALSIS